MQDNSSQTSVEILENVRKFIPSFSAIHSRDITVLSFSGGYVNTLSLVSAAQGIDVSPKTVVYRVYGNNFLARDILSKWSCLLNETEEILVAYEHGRRGWGPKVFGVFPGGRIEEYIPSHVLTSTEATDLTIALDIATAYARFHSMDFPFDKDRLDRLGKNYEEESVSYFKDLDPNFPFETPINLQEVLAFPLLDELHWISLVSKEIAAKKVFLQLDTNYGNILVRDTVEENQLKVVLIDYEVAVHGSRGVDIGGHFVCRLIGKKDESFEEKGRTVSGLSYPDEDFRRAFVRQYLKEWKSLKKSLDDNDTEDHLLMESDLGALTYALYRLNFTFKICDLLRHPNLFFLLLLFINFYTEHKKKFISKYQWKSTLPKERNCWLPTAMRNE